MDRNILVTYASKYGATAEIAVKVSEVLRQAGLQVDLSPVNEVRNLASYQAVILGSAVYIGKWPKEAEKFLQTHEKTLGERPIWIFASGPTGEGDPVALVEGQRLPASLQPIVNRIHPRDTAVFHGHINPEKLNGVEKFAIKSLVKKPFGDYRDWDAINAWAGAIAGELRDTHRNAPG